MHSIRRLGCVRLIAAVVPTQRIPERIVEKAVKGMLPRGRLGNNLYRHLKVTTN